MSIILFILSIRVAVVPDPDRLLRYQVAYRLDDGTLTRKELGFEEEGSLTAFFILHLMVLSTGEITPLRIYMETPEDQNEVEASSMLYFLGIVHGMGWVEKRLEYVELKMVKFRQVMINLNIWWRGI
ncbi:hypothetical protein DRQ18_00045 [bacterium]|nr:MAG: hypothetical protein DRQ18_00045 [bacterium]